MLLIAKILFRNNDICTLTSYTPVFILNKQKQYHYFAGGMNRWKSRISCLPRTCTCIHQKIGRTLLRSYRSRHERLFLLPNEKGKSQSKPSSRRAPRATSHATISWKSCFQDARGATVRASERASEGKVACFPIVHIYIPRAQPDGH